MVRSAEIVAQSCTIHVYGTKERHILNSGEAVKVIRFAFIGCGKPLLFHMGNPG